MRTIIKITKNELLEVLKKVDGKKAVFCSLVTNTDARLKKTNNPYKEVRKISKTFGMLNFNYTKSVQTEQGKEGLEKDFVAQNRKYGVKNDEYNGCLLFGANETKLIVKIDRTLKPKYIYQGKLIDKNKISSFLPTIPKSNTQNIEKQIIYRNFDLSNVKKITINKKTYKVVE